eukprot:scpid64441/ scgid19172/ 
MAPKWSPHGASVDRRCFSRVFLAAIGLWCGLWLLCSRFYLEDVFRRCSFSTVTSLLHPSQLGSRTRYALLIQAVRISAAKGGDDSEEMPSAVSGKEPWRSSSETRPSSSETSFRSRISGMGTAGAGKTRPPLLQATSTTSNKRRGALPGLIPFNCTSPWSWINQCNATCTRGTDPIPRLVHVVHIGDTLGFPDWLSVMSAVRFLRPQLIILHHTDTLTTCWARRIRSHPLVQFNKVTKSDFPSKINDRPVRFIAHLSDFMRVSALWQYGGIYMDLDIIITKPFDDLLVNEAVFAWQYRQTVCNALMVVQSGSCLMCRFAQRACVAYDGSWSRHSVYALTDMLVNETKSDSIKILPHLSGFYPFSWMKDDMEMLFRQDAALSNFSTSDAYSLHLFHSKLNKFGLENATTFEAVETANTPFALAARNILPPSFEVRHADEAECLHVPVVVSAV